MWVCHPLAQGPCNVGVAAALRCFKKPSWCACKASPTCIDLIPRGTVLGPLLEGDVRSLVFRPEPARQHCRQREWSPIMLACLAVLPGCVMR